MYQRKSSISDLSRQWLARVENWAERYGWTVAEERTEPDGSQWLTLRGLRSSLIIAVFPGVKGNRDTRAIRLGVGTGKPRHVNVGHLHTTMSVYGNNPRQD